MSALRAKRVAPAMSEEAETEDAEKHHCQSGAGIGDARTQSSYGNIVKIDTPIGTTQGVDERQ